MLQLDDLRLTQGAFTLEANLSVPRGGRLAVMGASGSGKTTLLSLIAGFVTPDRGRILMGGTDVTASPVDRRPLSILFQDSNLFPHLSVFDNVALALSTRLTLSEAQHGQVRDSLSKVGLDGMAETLPARLSGGQQSRVALARMLLRDKPLALFDEPFAALDPPLRRDMIDLVDQLCRDTGLTLVMVTHDMRDAQRLCDQLILLQDGRVRLQGATSTLCASPPEALRPWL
jgi:thiamine transport system ATP-binding protein